MAPDDPLRVSAVQRLHIIDGCQALDLPATLKYVRNLGNSDAHGKNISFFVSSGGLDPAPLYDLVCVNVYGDAYVQDMAMA